MQPGLGEPGHNKPHPSLRIIIALFSGNIKELLALSLARLDGSDHSHSGSRVYWTRRRAIHTAIVGIREVNVIKSYLEVVFERFTVFMSHKIFY